MSELFHQRQDPLIGPRTPVQRVYTAHGAVYVPISSEIQEHQPIRRETKRVIRRQVQTTDGRAGIEITEEHDVVYAPPGARSVREHGAKGIALAGVVSFIAICIAFTMFGGSSQSYLTMPLYWAGFGALWWALS